MKWFRFYSEVLDDPKIQTLPLATRWRWVEMLCIAAENGGTLPTSVKHLAYITRTRPQQLRNILTTLVEHGLIDESDGVMSPHGWAKRQYVSDDVTKRTRAHRERVGNVPGTPPEAEAEADTEAETDKEKLLLVRRNIFALYERTFGLLTPQIKPVLEEAEDKYPAEWLEAAFQEAAENRARSWRYVEAILRRWEDDGPQQEEGDNDDYEPIKPPEYDEGKEAERQEWLAALEERKRDRIRASAVSQRTS